MGHTNLKTIRSKPIPAAADMLVLKELGTSDIPAMLALQARVQSGDVITKDAASLSALFNAGNVALGLYHNGALVAQATIKKERDIPQTGTIGFMMTDPAHRGTGLSNILIGHALTKMGYMGFDIAQARVKIDNGCAAWKRFEKHGFTLSSIGESPDCAGRQVYTLSKTLDHTLGAHFLATTNNTAQRQRVHDQQQTLVAMAHSPAP